MRGGVLLDRHTGKPVVDPDLQRRLELLGRERVVDQLELGALLPHLQMAEVNPPLFMDVSNAYSGDELGLPYRDIMGEGIVQSTALAVTAGAGNSVNVAAGAAWVTGDTDVNAQPTYRMRNDAAVNLGISPDPANPRIVLVVAQIVDATFAGGSRTWQLQAIAGTPAASPVAPALPASAISLASVLVPAAAASSAAYTITDLRQRAQVGAGQAIPYSPNWNPLFDTTAGGAVASIDLQSIPATYRHLCVIAYLRGDAAVTGTGLQIRLNNDTGANYSSESSAALASTPSANESIAATSAAIGRLPGNTAPASSFSSVVFFVPNYLYASGHKTGVGFAASRELTTSGGMVWESRGFTWFAAAAAVNRLTLFPASGNFVAGSRVTVYGLG